MGRKQFRQDLIEAAQDPPPHIYGIETIDDGEIGFNYTYAEYGTTQHAGLRLLALNVDDYPMDNEYMIFAGEGDISPQIADSFEILTPLIKNRSIHQALSELSTVLHQAVTSGQSTNPIVLPDVSSDLEDEGYAEADSDDDVEEDEADIWLEGDEDEMFGFDEPKKPGPVAVGRTKMSQLPAEDRMKIKADLREAKDAGFKVGVIGDLSTSGIVCVSVRVAKLGISEDVMKAWTLEPQQYFVVLIRFQAGYQNIEILKEQSTLSGSTEIRLGLCSSYKPNSKSAFDTFNEVAADATNDSQLSAPRSTTDLQPLFIGRPLNDLFKSRFTAVVKFREIYCLGWAGAEQLVHDTQGAPIDIGKLTKYDKVIDSKTERALPAIVMADSMSQTRFTKNCSLPLVTMQFALRHFVRCTDFCLVCHCNSGSTFEALKPYVCSSPLCLYQYMGLGFGPSIEWEILSQPYVVDLLISFCYVQAMSGRLKDFPVGIDLRVPVLPRSSSRNDPHPSYSNYRSSTQSTATQTQTPPKLAFVIPYNGANLELLFPAKNLDKGQQLRKGDFVALANSNYFSGVIYHRIEDVLLPSVRLGPPVQVFDGDKPRSDILPNKLIDVDCYLFDTSFDDLSDNDRCKAIMTLLDTIPPVKDMLRYLKTHNVGQESSLRQWRDRISSSALNVLRWIIASNRSCIVQVDSVVEDAGTLKTMPNEDRISGMDEYMQFRFAQGAPDKEQRFIDCVKKQTAGKQYPTIFAWHGSPLHNWHSIIREGLHFKDTAHGRAYGNGVYMSNHAQTSLSYMSGHYSLAGSRNGWPNSELKVSGAMSLNEVVNKPDSYVSRSPHYVVGEIDWIQTRYLVVKTNVTHTKGEQADMETIAQDPAHTAMGMSQEAVQIPITAVARSRRPKEILQKDSKKRKSLGSGRIENPIEIMNDDVQSVATLNEDRDYLLDDESHSGRKPMSLDSDTEMDISDHEDLIRSPKKKLRQDESSTKLQLVEGCLLDDTRTDFFPGRLDMSNVKRLPAPDDASLAASSALLKAFNALMKTQKTTPAHELGWYMDPEQVDNLYQWIVELHSFDSEIPLSRDMKEAGITSVVLEMQFTNQYPFAPPFVRVVKPRFLPFNQGGGGHVTEGGAICMELLTNNGWSAVSTIESVLLQIKLAISDRERPARLPGSHGHWRAGGDGGVYGVGEAIAAYERACRAHGWAVPPAFASLRRGEGSGIGRFSS
ncbi:hypothetical protein LTS08_000858 [Lithohypha guttulata]|nr:hypothetical protein LTS08_000858 [Lithohypha guttulata]